MNMPQSSKKAFALCSRERVSEIARPPATHLRSFKITRQGFSKQIKTTPVFFRDREKSDEPDQVLCFQPVQLGPGRDPQRRPRGGRGPRAADAREPLRVPRGRLRVTRQDLQLREGLVSVHYTKHHPEFTQYRVHLEA